MLAGKSRQETWQNADLAGRLRRQALHGTSRQPAPAGSRRRQARRGTQAAAGRHWQARQAGNGNGNGTRSRHPGTNGSRQAGRQAVQQNPETQARRQAAAGRQDPGGMAGRAGETVHGRPRQVQAEQKSIVIPET